MISYVFILTLFSVQTMPASGGGPADGKAHPEAVPKARR